MNIAIAEVAEYQQSMLRPRFGEPLAHAVDIAFGRAHRQADVEQEHRLQLEQLHDVVTNRPQCILLRSAISPPPRRSSSPRDSASPSTDSKRSASRAGSLPSAFDEHIEMLPRGERRACPAAPVQPRIDERVIVRPHDLVRAQRAAERARQLAEHATHGRSRRFRASAVSRLAGSGTSRSTRRVTTPSVPSVPMNSCFRS